MRASLALRKGTLAAAATALLWLCGAAAVWALPKPQEIVQLNGATLQARSPNTAELRVAGVIMSGWHINSDHPPDPNYIPTRFSVAPAAGTTAGAIRYPAAELIAPAFSAGTKLSVFTGSLAFETILTESHALGAGAELPIRVNLDYQACNNVQCLRPVTISRQFTVSWPIDTAGAQGAATAGAASPSAALPNLFTRHSLWAAFALIFLGGLALNLTPCVYPLMGVTVAYFGNQSGGGTRLIMILAALYVGGLALSFSAAGTIVALTGGLFGSLMANPYVLGTLALVLLTLAGSCFGLYSMDPPQWMMRRAATARPGYLGALGMGFGMGVVAAPCIGPFVVGLLLVVQQSRSPLFGFAVFFVLALGMGLPYLALAMGAGHIRRLPRSGAWLAWVERLFGFILVGLALYFLDPLTPERLATRILPYYAAAVGIYLGFLSPIGREIRGFKLFKLALGTVSAAFLIELAIPKPAPARLAFSPFGTLPMSSAARQHRPVILDFAADWCIPCREMEHTTFTDRAVVDAAHRFVALRADLTRSDSATASLVSRYQVQGVPTTLLIGSDGKVEKRMVGYVGPQQFLASLRAIN